MDQQLNPTLWKAGGFGSAQPLSVSAAGHHDQAPVGCSHTDGHTRVTGAAVQTGHLKQLEPTGLDIAFAAYL